jgi:hypothetical protein
MREAYEPLLASRDAIASSSPRILSRCCLLPLCYLLPITPRMLLVTRRMLPITRCTRRRSGTLMHRNAPMESVLMHPGNECAWQVLDTRSPDETSWLNVTPEIADDAGPRCPTVCRVCRVCRALRPLLPCPPSCSLLFPGDVAADVWLPLCAWYL